MERSLKNIRTLSSCVLSIGIIAGPSAAIAAAWTLEAGQGQTIVTATASRASEAFDNSRDLHSTPRYEKQILQALIEYGVNDRLTLIITPGLQHVGIGAPTLARGNPNFVELGGRYRFTKGRNWVLSTQVTARWADIAGTSGTTPVDDTGSEVDLRGLFGYFFSLDHAPAFLDVQVGHRFRSGGSPNEIHADVTFGIRPSTNWLFLAQSFNVVSEGAGDPGFPRYEYFKFQPSAVYQLTKHWAVQAGAFTTYRGRNALQENGLVLGAWITF